MLALGVIGEKIDLLTLDVDASLLAHARRRVFCGDEVMVNDDNNEARRLPLIDLLTLQS
jgi:hypothetical protein